MGGCDVFRERARRQRGLEKHGLLMVTGVLYTSENRVCDKWAIIHITSRYDAQPVKLSVITM